MTRGQLRGKNACQSYLVTQILVQRPPVSLALRTGRREFFAANSQGGYCANAASESHPRYRPYPAAALPEATSFGRRYDWPLRNGASRNSGEAGLLADRRRSADHNGNIFDRSFFWLLGWIAN